MLAVNGTRSSELRLRDGLLHVLSLGGTSLLQRLHGSLACGLDLLASRTLDEQTEESRVRVRKEYRLHSRALREGSGKGREALGPLDGGLR